MCIHMHGKTGVLSTRQVRQLQVKLLRPAPKRRSRGCLKRLAASLPHPQPGPLPDTKRRTTGPTGGAMHMSCRSSGLARICTADAQHAHMPMHTRYVVWAIHGRPNIREQILHSQTLLEAGASPHVSRWLTAHWARGILTQPVIDAAVVVMMTTTECIIHLPTIYLVDADGAQPKRRQV